MSEMCVPGLNGRCPFWRLEGEDPSLCLCSFQGPPAHIPWLVASSMFTACDGQLGLSYPVPLTLTLLPPSSIAEDPCDYLGPTWIIQVSLPISRSTDQQS